MSDIAQDAWSPDDFLGQLELVPWFTRIGEPTPADAGVERIHSWEAWPGPEEPSILELFDRHQPLKDAIMANAGDRRHGFSALWDLIRGTVLRAAAPRVPYDPQQDAWHAPTSAAWHAAWTAGLIGLYLASGRPIPDDLREQWKWFVRGHWPCGYAWLDGDNQPGPLLVY